MNKEEIKKEIDKLWERVDYVVGDWVETCNLLPAIVQNIVIRYDEKNDYIEEYVEVFYPHMANNGKYNGGSICSIDHCGVHKITPQYACMLMSLGHDKLSELWDEATKAWNNDSQKSWEMFVIEEYEKEFINKVFMQQ